MKSRGCAEIFFRVELYANTSLIQRKTYIAVSILDCSALAEPLVTSLICALSLMLPIPYGLIVEWTVGITIPGGQSAAESLADKATTYLYR